MNVVVVIQGREAIPVRAVPFMNYWEIIGPDDVSKALAGEIPWGKPNPLSAYHLDGENVKPVDQRYWANTALPNLAELSAKLTLIHSDCDLRNPSWNRESVNLLPAEVFVWKDELIEWHRRRYNPRIVVRIAESGRMSQDEYKNSVALDFDPFIADAQTRSLVMDWFEGLQTDALTHAAPVVPESQAMTPSPAPVVAESVMTSAPKLKQPAQESRILELLTSQGHDPMNLPNRPTGKSGVKSEIRKMALAERALFTAGTFDDAWQRLRADGRVADGK